MYVNSHLVLDTILHTIMLVAVWCCGYLVTDITTRGIKYSKRVYNGSYAVNCIGATLIMTLVEVICLS